MQVIFRGKSLGNNVTVYNCYFYLNQAVWGGGLKASFQDESRSNYLVIVNSVFQQNTCFRNGGGGASVGYTFYREPLPFHNKILFKGCEFIQNEAKFGGGLSFYSSDSTYSELNNKVEFNNCTWKTNIDRLGSAVSVSIQAWTTVLMETFQCLILQTQDLLVISLWTNFIPLVIMSSIIKELGLFFATRYTLFFHEYLEFKNNNGSGMYLTSSVMKIAPNTEVLFIGNSGFDGGAIALIAFSVIVLGDNSSLFLENNTAVRCRGAIYSYSIDKHDYLSSRSCFIQNNSTIVGLYQNVTVYFLNDTVEQQKINSSTTHYCGH